MAMLSPCCKWSEIFRHRRLLNVGAFAAPSSVSLTLWPHPASETVAIIHRETREVPHDELTNRQQNCRCRWSCGRLRHRCCFDLCCPREFGDAKPGCSQCSGPGCID